MRFRGLPVNTPTKEQYQLWIFDRNQSEETPIDGGVFDITSAEEVILPINAKLLIQEAYMFAVTIEKPGGVVVSSRERFPLVANVE
jgi:anti-sigma-K factor RskA